MPSIGRYRDRISQPGACPDRNRTLRAAHTPQPHAQAKPQAVASPKTVNVSLARPSARKPVSPSASSKGEAALKLSARTGPTTPQTARRRSVELQLGSAGTGSAVVPSFDDSPGGKHTSLGACSGARRKDIRNSDRNQAASAQVSAFARQAAKVAPDNAPAPRTRSASGVATRTPPSKNRRQGSSRLAEHRVEQLCGGSSAESAAELAGATRGQRLR